MKINPLSVGPIKDYLKYYWLEEYLEKKVQPAFVKNHFLTAEQFFAIIEWKNAKFGKMKLSYLKEEDIRKLTEDIYVADELSNRHDSKKRRLEILLWEEKENGEKKNRKGIKLATASAILTILYPDEFTVYDIRVRKQLCNCGQWKKVQRRKEPGKWDPSDITYHENVVEEYFKEYLPAVEKLRNGISLRDCDRALWAKDWHEDLEDFIASVNKPDRKELEKDLQVSYDIQI